MCSSITRRRSRTMNSSHLLNDVYCTHGFDADLFKIDDQSARILTSRDPENYLTLRFAPDEKSRKAVPRLWRPAKSMPPAKAEKPLVRNPHRARPRSSRRQMGEDGGALVPGRKQQASHGRRSHVARLASACIAIAQVRRDGFFVRTGNDPVTFKRPGRLSRARQKNPDQERSSRTPPTTRPV